MFVQIMEFRLKPGKWDELQALGEEWVRTEGGSSPGWLGDDLLRDRKDPNHIMMVGRFESAELAAQNSTRPETHALYMKLVALLEEEPRFVDCDLEQELRPTGRA